MTIRRSKPVVLLAAVTTLCITGASEKADAHGGSPKCHRVKGDFSAMGVPVPPCESAVGICTTGKLGGTLRGGSYEFTMNTLNPVPEPDVPFVAFFSGVSSVTTRSGHVLSGIDTGAMDLSPPGQGNSGAFSTLLTFTSGGTGYLNIRGNLDFTTGQATGAYSGEICSE